MGQTAMKQGRSAYERPLLTPSDHDLIIETVTQWLDDHGWHKETPHSWKWLNTGQCITVPDQPENCAWIIKTVTTAVLTMNKQQKPTAQINRKRRAHTSASH